MFQCDTNGAGCHSGPAPCGYHGYLPLSWKYCWTTSTIQSAFCWAYVPPKPLSTAIWRRHRERPLTTWSNYTQTNVCVCVNVHTHTHVQTHSKVKVYKSCRIKEFLLVSNPEADVCSDRIISDSVTLQSFERWNFLNATLLFFFWGLVSFSTNVISGTWSWKKRPSGFCTESLLMKKCWKLRL